MLMMTFVLIDNQPLMLKGLTLCIQEHFTDINLIEAKSLNDYESFKYPEDPALFILGINENQFRENVASLRLLSEQYPSSAIIIYDDGFRLDLTTFYHKAKVKGYVCKQDDIRELLQCIEAVTMGETYSSLNHRELVRMHARQ